MTRVGTSFDEYMATHARADLIFSGRPSNTETFVLNGVTFTYLVAGNSDLDDDLEFLAALVNASTDVAIAGLITATPLPTGTATELRFTADVAGTTANDYALTEALSNCTRSGATFTAGTDQANTEIMTVSRTLDASDDTLDSVVITTPFTKIMEFSATLHDAGILDTSNQPKFVVSGGTLTITDGNQSWAAGDILTVTIKGYTTARVTS